MLATIPNLHFEGREKNLGLYGNGSSVFQTLCCHFPISPHQASSPQLYSTKISAKTHSISWLKEVSFFNAWFDSTIRIIPNLHCRGLPCDNHHNVIKSWGSKGTKHRPSCCATRFPIITAARMVSNLHPCQSQSTNTILWSNTRNFHLNLFEGQFESSFHPLSWWTSISKYFSKVWYELYFLLQ